MTLTSDILDPTDKSTPLPTRNEGKPIGKQRERHHLPGDIQNVIGQDKAGRPKRKIANHDHNREKSPIFWSTAADFTKAGDEKRAFGRASFFSSL
jgi:hypothetical protein